MANLPRTLNPALNSTGFMAAAGAIYAAAAMIYNVYNHHGVLQAPVVLAAVAAVASLLIRQRVTPVADPVDGAGRTLVPLPGLVPAPVLAVTEPGGNVHVVAPQPAGVSQVIIEGQEDPRP
jgi:multidrug efflux pump subunit AcrA (membrane-fusion protein)